MKFVDETQIFVRSGDGGAGMVSFASAHGKPKLGPDGGDGGDGGNVFLIGNSQLNTLSGLRYKQRFIAQHGAKGGPNGRTGRRGEDAYVPVPLGTIALNCKTGEKVAEILHADQAILVAKGGRHGWGNMRFVRPNHQAPEEHGSGLPGEAFELKLELKLIADVGFAGLPNAGKSTLLSRISAAKPKIADYPFTTLTPNLGVVDVDGDQWGESFVAADIPGLIDGASDGKGLGHQFLRHLERTKAIAYVLDGASFDGTDPFDAFEILQRELNNYSATLASKPALVVVTKTDVMEEDFDRIAIVDKLAGLNIETLFISSVTGDGITELKRRLANMARETNKSSASSADLSPET